MSYFKGKENSAQPNNKKVGEKVCLKLTSFYHGGNQRTLTADNFFASINLADLLFEQNFRFVGTLRKNKAEIPGCFQPHKNKAVHSSIFGFRDKKTLVSYVPKKNKAVVLISTEHQTKSVNVSNDSKPAIIEFYNKTKGSVDALDQKIEKFTCRRKSNR